MGTIDTRPPANSAERSGEYDLFTWMLSSRPAGNRSSGTTFLSGSVVGMIAPDSVVLLYRSPRPRTKTNWLSTTDRPVMRVMAAAASESPLLFISVAPRLSVMMGACLRSTSCISAVEVTASSGAAAVTVTVSANDAIDSPMLTSARRCPAVTSILTARGW